MDSEFVSTKRSFGDHEVVLLGEGSTNQRSRAPRCSWFFQSVGVLFLVFTFAVVARQQLQIIAMEDRLAGIQQDLLDDDMPSSDIIFNPANDTATATELLSRSRRQASVRSTSQSTRTSFAHLQGELTRTRLPSRSTDAYRWINPTGDSERTSPRDMLSLAHACTDSGGNYVYAIRVVLEGWYYVYAQLPYMARDYRNTVGHKIVVIPNGGVGQPLDVMATTLTLPSSSGSSNGRNWQYLGGMVYLSTRSHVEVRPTHNFNSPNKPFTEESAREGGAFFGLFLVKENTSASHRNEGC